MSKKDYRAFAEMLHKHVEYAQRRPTYDEAAGALNAVCGIADDMCQIFARDNSRFDSERFMTAVREGVK